MIKTQPGGSSDCQDGSSTGEEEEEVPMGKEEVDVIGINDDKDDDDDDDDGVGVDVDEDNDPAPVACSEKMVAYCKTFNLIDKGNINGGSKTHKLTTKLLFRLFNMTLNNVYRIYSCLHKRHRQQEGG